MRSAEKFPDKDLTGCAKTELARGTREQAQQACKKVHECMVAMIGAINDCCIDYTPGGGGIQGGCNSNCVFIWLSTCAGPRLRMPAGGPAPGINRRIPECVTKNRRIRGAVGPTIVPPPPFSKTCTGQAKEFANRDS